MAVISGIITAVKIGLRVAPIVYKGIKSTKAGAQWLSRHPKVVKGATVAAGAGGLLLDLTSIDFSGLLPKKSPKYGETGQTRNYMVQSKSKRFRNNYCYPRKRRTSRFQRY